MRRRRICKCRSCGSLGKRKSPERGNRCIDCQFMTTRNGSCGACGLLGRKRSPERGNRCLDCDGSSQTGIIL
jgi:hypothetical protein